MHPCPIVVCHERCPHHNLMCRGHWFLVPEDLRTEVWRAYNQYQAAPGYDINRLERLRAVQKKAIEAVEARLAATQQPREPA